MVKFEIATRSAETIYDKELKNFDEQIHKKEIGQKIYFSKKEIYTGHMLGTTLTAISVCMFIFMIEGMKLRSDYFKTLSRFEMMIPYFVCSPVYYFLMAGFQAESGELAYFIGSIASIIVVAASYLILYLYAFIRKSIKESKEADKDDGYDDDDKEYKKEYKSKSETAGSDEK